MNELLAALAGAAVTALGALIVAWRSSSWQESRVRQQLAAERYREGRDLLDELVRLAGNRHFLMQQLLWALASPEDYDVPAIRKEYRSVIREWNTRTWSYRARLRMLLGDDVAMRFLDYRDDARPRGPQSLHYMFVKCHREVMLSEKERQRIPIAQATVDELNHAWSQFADKVTEKLLRRASGLRLLEVPGERA